MDKLIKKYLSNTINNNGCMEWQGGVDSRDGYPRVNYRGNTNTRLHRLIYKGVTGENVDELVVRHKCDNILCINPRHLESGTHWDNIHDREIRLRSGNSKTNPEEVIRIRQLFAEGKYTKRQLGIIFNLNERTIGYIVLNKTWAWV